MVRSQRIPKSSKALTTSPNGLVLFKGSRVPMVKYVRERKMRPRTIHEKILLETSTARLFSFLVSTSGRITMQSAVRSSIGYQRAVIRAGLRTPVTSTRRWTGRARVSMATNTVIPKCVTTTTHRTRVSEMRSSVSRGSRDLLVADPVRTETLNLRRRDPGLPRHLSG
jgi:hypothetical protein